MNTTCIPLLSPDNLPYSLLVIQAGNVVTVSPALAASVAGVLAAPEHKLDSPPLPLSVASHK